MFRICIRSVGGPEEASLAGSMFRRQTDWWNSSCNNVLLKVFGELILYSLILSSIALQNYAFLAFHTFDLQSENSFRLLCSKLSLRR